jgi:hypothetical protein
VLGEKIRQLKPSWFIPDMFYMFLFIFFVVVFPHKDHQYQGESNTAQKSFNIRKQFFKKYCQNTTATREKLANAGLENYKK